MTTTATIECLSETLGPLTHMSGTVGNQAVLAAERVLTRSGERLIPFLSGNAFRHSAVRQPGMLWLIDQYDLEGNLSLAQLNFLLHGGNLTSSTAIENTRRIADMKRTWPLLRLLGGSLPNQILAGSLDVWRGALICEENRASLRRLDLPPARLRPAQSFVGDYQYVRQDAVKSGIATTDAEGDAERQSNLMIMAGQAVQKGAVFHHGFVCKHVLDLELGALFWSLRLWQAAGGTIGGQASRGHGRLKCRVISGSRLNQKKLVDQYVEYAIGIKEEAVAWLNEAWG